MAYRPAAPFNSATTGTIDQKLSAIADELNNKTNRGTEEHFTTLILTSANGDRWQVSVSNAGALTVIAAP
jgi:hypothetical protein